VGTKQLRCLKKARVKLDRKRGAYIQEMHGKRQISDTYNGHTVIMIDYISLSSVLVVGERAKRARHYQV